MDMKNYELKIDTKNLQLKNPIDEQSAAGKFGWDITGGIPIPYIFRDNEKYTTARIVNVKILSRFLSFFTQELYNCFKIIYKQITATEIQLLNEINGFHCDNGFGTEPFGTQDFVISMEDVRELYNYLSFCYDKLILKHYFKEAKCGFLHINEKNYVPYVMKNGIKFVPLFYFEGDTEIIHHNSLNLAGWEYTYLKFCFKYQGIRSNFFGADSCKCVDVNHVRIFFPPNSSFQCNWPDSGNASIFLINTEEEKSKNTPTNVPTISEKENYPANSLPYGVVKENADFKEKEQHTNPAKVLPYLGLQETEIPFIVLNENEKNLPVKEMPYTEIPNSVYPAQESTDRRPYKLLILPLMTKKVRCINIRPFIYTDLMVPLYEIYHVFFGNYNKEDFILAFGELKLSCFSPNAHQVKELTLYNLYHRDVLSLLVMVRDVTTAHTKFGNGIERIQNYLKMKAPKILNMNSRMVYTNESQVNGKVNNYSKMVQSNVGKMIQANALKMIQPSIQPLASKSKPVRNVKLIK